MVFYPDNAQRASRLQQLVDSMANMQTDIKNDAKKMDDTNIAIRPQIDILLKQNGFLTLDDLIAKSTALLTPDERKQFEAMVAQAQASKAGFDWTYFAAGLLMLPEGFILTGKVVLAAGRFVLNTSLVQSISDCFKAGAEGGAEAASEVAEAAESVADKSSQEIGESGEVVGDVAEAVSILGTLGTLFKVLGGIGFVVTLVVGIVELVEGAEQKSQLIDAIHGCQGSRLAIKYFKVQADNILENLALMQTYLNAMVGGGGLPPSPIVAQYIAQSILTNISTADAAIDWNALEAELEAQDETSSLFYGADDLSAADVVAVAKGKAGPPPPIYTPPAAPTPAALKTTAVKSAAPPAPTPAQTAQAAQKNAAAALAAARVKAAAAAHQMAINKSEKERHEAILHSQQHVFAQLHR